MGKLYLIPTPMGETASWDTALPAGNRAAIDSIEYFVVENARTARRFLARSGIGRTIDARSLAGVN
ncbi:MAG: SAM-dependent methyltransferase, partial [Rikenellaceae bacterium]|nr:SAM-dependent methyltransferase [Rikenellaceae bacterium]